MEPSDVQSAVCDVAAGSDGYGCWQHPFRGTQIRMHPVPLRHLSDEALRLIKTKPVSEIGGILWGRVVGDSVVIEDAQLLPSGGPLYNATPSDIRSLEQAIRRNHPNGLKLIGYFRSHIRDGLCLSTQDQELITKYLCNPEYVFLLIRPFEMGICVGAFFFWENGRLQTDGSDLEVPFLALEHPSVSEHQVTADSTAKPEMLKVPEQHQDQVAPRANISIAARFSPERRVTEQPQAFAPPSRSTKRSWFPLIGFALLAAVMAAAGTAAYFTFPVLRSRMMEVATPTASDPHVGLKVVRGTDGQLDLSWDRDALGRVHASHGLLTITDGSTPKQLLIDDAQVHSGTLTYFPNSADVQFRLEITLDGGHSIAESIRVIVPQANIAAKAPAAPNRTAIQNRAAAEPAPMPVNMGSLHPKRAVRASFQAPSYIPRVLTPKQRIEYRAPDLKLDPAVTAYVPPSSLPALPAPFPNSTAQLSTPAVSKNSLQAKRMSAQPASATSMTTSARSYVPPQPLRQVMPDARLARYALKSQSGRVEVLVVIDEHGRVKDVQAVSSGGKSNGLVVSAAIAAARQWTFRPATLHGKAITAEHRIVFDFRPENQ